MDLNLRLGVAARTLISALELLGLAPPAHQYGAIGRHPALPQRSISLKSLVRLVAACRLTGC